MNFTIRDLDIASLENICKKCSDCTFWLKNERINIFDDLTQSSNVFGFLKSRIFDFKSRKNKNQFISFFKENGGKIKTISIGKKCIGTLLAGKYYLFPKLKRKRTL